MGASSLPLLSLMWPLLWATQYTWIFSNHIPVPIFKSFDLFLKQMDILSMLAGSLLTWLLLPQLGLDNLLPAETDSPLQQLPAFLCLCIVKSGSVCRFLINIIQVNNTVSALWHNMNVILTVSLLAALIHSWHFLLKWFKIQKCW